MEDTRWFTTEDIAKDLAGGDGAGLVNGIEGYVVRGHRPPPTQHEVLDDKEMELHFGPGVVSCRRPSADDVIAPSAGAPDIAGITDMLRMVEHEQCNTIDGRGDEDVFLTMPEADTKIIISKMNPAVAEFRPKSVNPDQSNVKQQASRSELHKEQNQPKLKTDQVELQTIIPNENKAKMESMLKNKIIEASKSNSFEQRRAKNVAIATLLNLYSVAPQESLKMNGDSSKHEPPCSPNSNATRPVLCTPEYFEGNKIVAKDADKNNKPAPEVEPPPKPELDSVKESIDKVIDWLNTPPVDDSEKTKPMVPYTGPIVFSKKSCSKSIQNQAQKSKNCDKPVSETPSYVPGSYATELAKKYEDRAKERALKEYQQLDIWTKLQVDLKAKDEVIRGSSSNSTPSNRSTH